MSWAALDRVCRALTEGDRDAAAGIARTDYPFAPPDNAGRHYGEALMMRVFRRWRRAAETAIG